MATTLGIGLLFVLSVVTLFLIAYKFQKMLVLKSEDEIKLKNAEIEKDVNSKSIDTLVSENNKRNS